MKQCDGNTKYYVDPNETIIEIGLKGSNEDGLVQKRMSAIKQQMSASLKHTIKAQQKERSPFAAADPQSSPTPGEYEE